VRARAILTGKQEPSPEPGQLDERPEVAAMLARLKASLPDLRRLNEECSGWWAYEDGLYRFYHQSFKVYSLQDWTTRIVAALGGLAPERPLHPWFAAIVEQGTGIVFEREHNARWTEVARPIVEAFLHAKYFLDMAVRYGEALDAPPTRSIPTGWAALLYLYGLR
jgi:hypothetical protein